MKKNKNITETIKSVFDNLRGSFSIVLTNIMEPNTIYYFKNSKTSIYANWLNGKTLHFTTNEKNTMFYHLISGVNSVKSMNFKSNRIYMITAFNHYVGVKVIGSIKQSNNCLSNNYLSNNYLSNNYLSNNYQSSFYAKHNKEQYSAEYNDYAKYNQYELNKYI